MRTKTLFLAAAALAAGIATSTAQSNVYSVNIVGYYGVSIPANTKTLIANQLDNGTNTLNDVLATIPNKSYAYIWGGSSFQTIQKLSGSFTPNASVAPGTGFFVVTPSTAGTVTNTFIGSAPTTNNVPLAANVKVLVGARIPFSGNANDFGGNTLNLGGLPNKTYIYLWAGTSYNTYQKLAGAYAGNPAIATGQGFFVSPNSATTWINWIQ